MRSLAEPVATDARERILESACDLIAADGIDEVRIARVATRAGASTALVHHYFATREELLEQALVHSFESVGDERFGGEPEGAGAAEHLKRVIRECLPEPGRQERDWVLWVELWLRAARDPDLRPIAARLYRRYRGWVARAIRLGVEEGAWDADPEAVADYAVALFGGLGVRTLLGDPSMRLDQAREAIAARLALELELDPVELLG